MSTWSTATGNTSYTSTYSGRHTHLHGMVMPTYQPAPPPVLDQPSVKGRGPLVCSASRALAVRPLIVWDNNRYYRDLGIGFPYRPTRAEIREAWFAKDPGAARGVPGNARLTFVVGQLLNKEVRDHYDNLPFDELIIDDYVRAAIKRKVLDEVRLRAARTGADLIDGLEDLERSVYRDMGIEVDDDEDDDSLAEVLDALPQAGQDASRPAKFEYAYFVWRSHTVGPVDQTLLDWQSLLSTALSERGVTTTYAVGLHGRMPQSYLVAEIGGIVGFLLHHHETPTIALAQAAVGQWLADTGRTPSHREIEPS